MTTTARIDRATDGAYVPSPRGPLVVLPLPDRPPGPGTGRGHGSAGRAFTVANRFGWAVYGPHGEPLTRGVDRLPLAEALAAGVAAAERVARDWADAAEVAS